MPSPFPGMGPYLEEVVHNRCYDEGAYARGPGDQLDPPVPLRPADAE